jgi:hypothetical protein
MFVGIDEYDAAARRVALDCSCAENEQTRSINAAAIESFFNESLFSILKAACSDGPFGCIDKYLLAGVLPAFRTGTSPLSGVKSISDVPQFHGICGLTEQQLRIIAKAYLYPHNGRELESRVRSLQKFCNGYCFAWSSHPDTDITEKKSKLARLGNPHLAFQYLSDFKNCGSFTPREDFHPTSILKSVPDLGKFSWPDLKKLESEGPQKTKILTKFGFTDLVMLPGKDSQMTLSLLVYLGALTGDEQPGVVQIPNRAMRDMVINVFPGLLNILLNRKQLAGFGTPRRAPLA